MSTIEQELIDLETRLTTKIDILRTEKNSLAEDLKNLTTELATVKQALEKSIANETSTRLKEIKAANTAINAAISASTQLKSDIQNGNVVAKKAIMLRARNGNHWMIYKRTDSKNNDCFALYSSDDKWYDNIKVLFYP